MTQQKVPGGQPRKSASEKRSRAPVTKGRAPVTKGRAPVTRKRAPVTRDRAPVRQGRASATGERTSATKRRAPVTQGRAPVTGQRSSAQVRSYKSSNTRQSGTAARQSGGPVQKSREELRQEARLKKAKQRKRKRRFTAFLLVLFVLLIATVLSLTVFFKVNVIEVTGTSQYEAKTISDVSGIDIGDNLFLVKKAKVAEQISRSLPYTGEITIKRSFPNKIVIHVMDSAPSCAVAEKKGYVVLNDEQKVLAKVADEEALYTLVAQQKKIRSAAEKAAAASGKAETASGKAESSSEKTEASSEKTEASSEKAGASSEKTGTSSGKTGTSSEKTGTASEKTEASAEKTATASDGGTETASQTEGKNTDTASVSVTEKEKEAAKKEIMILTGLTVKEAEPGKQIVLAESTAFDTYREIRDAVQETDFTGITAMDLRNSNDLRLQYENRIVLKLGTTSGLVKKLEMAKKVLEEQNKISTELTGTIDLTISGRAYFAEGEETDNASESATSTDTAGTEQEEKTAPKKAESSSAVSSAKGSSASG